MFIELLFANPAAGLPRERRSVLPLPAGEGRGEGESAKTGRAVSLSIRHIGGPVTLRFDCDRFRAVSLSRQLIAPTTMDPTFSEWLKLILRWTHIFAGIMWVGTTYFFTW